MLRRNGPVVKSVESVLHEAGRESMVGKIFERGRSWGGSETERELWSGELTEWEDDVQCRSMNRQDRIDRGTGMRLTERTRKLIPETRRGVYRKERSVMRIGRNGWCRWSSEGITWDEERVLRGGWTEMSCGGDMEVGWLWGLCKWVKGVCIQCVQLFWDSEESVRQEWCDRI